ncbi:P-loop NTPase fold protein [Bacteroides thetaiotaomicron]|uniref:P-loop NTPase fold protein n=1 Tax=Bacteroides thetaiotaomicron TaxID=818 RepID=UPI0039C394C3
MNCKLEKLEIPADQPFWNCKLDREKYAEILKTIITTYQKGFVLAINGRWGTGKTTFVEMWKAYLELDNFHTLYFNAWENDFISDPLIGLLGELKKMSKQQKSKDLLSSIIKAGGKIVLYGGPAMVKGVIKHYTGEDVTNVVADFAKEGSSMLKKSNRELRESKI